MLHSLADNPWPALLVCLVALAIFATAFGVTRRGLYLVPIVLCLLGMLVPLALGMVLVTPRKEVDQLLDRLAQAALDDDAQTIVSAISSDYEHQGMRAEQLTSLVRAVLKSARFDSIDLNARKIEASGSKATARFVAVMSGAYAEHQFQRHPMRFSLALERQSDGWKIYRVRRFPVVGNSSEEIPLGQP